MSPVAQEIGHIHTHRRVYKDKYILKIEILRDGKHMNLLQIMKRKRFRVGSPFDNFKVNKNNNKKLAK